MQRVIRVVAVVLGLLLLAASLPHALGLVPSSEEQTGAQYVKNLVLPALAGVALAFPYRKLRSRRARAIGLIGIGVSLLWALLVAFPGIIGYVRGTRSWHIVPSVLLFLVVVGANAWVFWRSRAHTAD